MPTKNGNAWVVSANSAQQMPSPTMLRKNVDDEHGDGSRDKDCKGRAFHHHHGAVQGITDPVRVWNPLRSSFRQEQAMRESRPVAVAMETDIERWR
jgi:hypothetical protein